MAILTWRNIQIPDFHGAQQGIRTAGELLSRAVDHAGTGVGILQDAQRQAADKAILARSMAIQDPEEYARQMAAGQIVGPDMRNASLETIQAAEARQGALLQRAAQQYDFTRARAVNAEKDLVASRLAQAAPIAEGGDPSAAYRLATEGTKHFETGAAAIRLLNQLPPNPVLTKALQDDKKKEELLDFARQIRNEPDPVKRREMLYDSNVPAWKSIGAEQLLNTLGENVTTEVASSRATMGVQAPLSSPNYDVSNADNSFFGLHGDGVSEYGWYPPKNLSEATAGEWEDYGKELIQLTKNNISDGKSKGTSAFGRYQITNTTLREYAPKVFGDNWRNETMNGENQRKIAEAIFNDRKNRDITVTWPGLSGFTDMQGEGKLKGKSFADVEHLIAYEESGRMPPNYQQDLQIREQALANIQERLSGDPAAMVALEAAGKHKSLGTAAQELAASFKDADDSVEGEIQNFVREQVNRHKGKVTIAEVTAALKSSLGEDRSWTWANFKGGLDVIQTNLDNMVKDLPTAREKVKTFQNEVSRTQQARELLATHTAESLQFEAARLRNPKLGSPQARHLKRMAEAGREIRKLIRLGQESTVTEQDFTPRSLMSEMPSTTPYTPPATILPPGSNLLY